MKIVYMGDIGPGDTLVIDPENDTAMLNDQDVSGNLAVLEPFELLVGTNRIEYTDRIDARGIGRDKFGARKFAAKEDDQGTRTLAVTVAWTERYV